MDKVNHMADLDSVDQIAERAGKDDEKRQMIKKGQIPDLPDDKYDKKN